MKFETIIFDFDGTIADTLDAMIILFNQVSTKYNLPQIDESNRKKMRELSAKELINELKISKIKFIRLTKELLPKLKNNLDQINLIIGMEEVLRSLKDNNFKIGVVSSNSKENIELFLNQHQIKGVDFVYSEKGLFGKDKVLKNVIKKHHLDASKVIYVGDEARDVEAAHKAGLPIIAVSWGFNSKTRLVKAKPDYIIDQPSELLTKLN